MGDYLANLTAESTGCFICDRQIGGMRMESDHDRIESILVTALEIQSEIERQKYVQEACGTDTKIRARVNELIENHRQAGSFLVVNQLLEIDEALARFEYEFPDNAAVVKLRYFAGFTNAETAEALGISAATAQRRWTFARVWLFNELSDSTRQ